MPRQPGPFFSMGSMPSGSISALSVKAARPRSTHTMHLKGDGTLWVWGNNTNGQLGNGTTTNSSVPVQLSGLIRQSRPLAAGNDYTVALKNDGTVRAWGDNAFGQLGDGSTTQRTTPVQVPGLTGCDGDCRRLRPYRCPEERRLRLGVGKQQQRPTRRWKHDTEKQPGAGKQRVQCNGDCRGQRLYDGPGEQQHRLGMGK